MDVVQHQLLRPGGEQAEAAHLHVLLDDSDGLFHRPLEILRLSRLALGQGDAGELASQGYEVLVLGHEVRLAGQLQQHAQAAAQLREHPPLVGGPAGALGRRGQAQLLQDALGLLEVP